MSVFLHVPPVPLVDARGVITHSLQRPTYGAGVRIGGGQVNPASFRSVIPSPSPLGNFPQPMITMHVQPQKLTLR